MYDAVLATLAHAPVERAFVLADADSVLTDLDHDDTVIARRLPKAQAYLAQFEALPTMGYATGHDRAAVPERHYKSLRKVLLAASRVHQIPVLLAATRQFFRLLPHWDVRERFDHVHGYPYEAVYLALADRPGGRAAIDSIRAHLASSRLPTGR